MNDTVCRRVQSHPNLASRTLPSEASRAQPQVYRPDGPECHCVLGPCSRELYCDSGHLLRQRAQSAFEQ